MSTQSFNTEEFNAITNFLYSLKLSVLNRENTKIISIFVNENDKHITITKDINLVNNKVSYFVEVESPNDSYETSLLTMNSLLEFIGIEIKSNL